MTSDEQLEEWVKGNPIHNDEHDECCPDFSCCQPQLLADEDTRLRFKMACLEVDDGTKYEMLGMFLGAAMAEAGKDVYVAGSAAVEHPEQ